MIKVIVNWSEVYSGDDPKYAMDLASMIREEEPSGTLVFIVLDKE